MFKKIALVLAGLSASAGAFAAADPYAAITAAADWSDVLPVIGVVAGALAIVFVLRKGAKIAVGMVK